MYRFAVRDVAGAGATVALLGSGAIMRETIAAAELLAAWNVRSEIYSVTSYSELARDASETERWNRLHPTAPPRCSHVATLLAGTLPVIAASDYVRAHAQTIAPFVAGRFVALGTDGFGRSDTRAVLRRFFEVDRQHIAVAALQALALDGAVPARIVAEALDAYGIDVDAMPSWSR